MEHQKLWICWRRINIAQSIANELRLQNEKLNLIIAEEATKFPPSTFIASTCHTNPVYEKDPLNGDKRLDELLSAQKQHGDKTGLGFISKSKKKRNKKNNNNNKKFSCLLLLRSTSLMTYALMRTTMYLRRRVS
jgi:hypothetical protein